MAKCIYFGLTQGHDSRYGIKHSNIARKFTRLNWNSKAIVRDGHYICIKVGEYTNDEDNRVKRYFISGCPDKTGFKKEHKYLMDAINMANSYSKQEGVYPKEFEPGYSIFSKNKYFFNKIAEFKPNKY